MVRKGADGAMRIERVPLPPLDPAQQAIIEEMK